MASPPTRFICLICRNPIPHAGAECAHCRARTGGAVAATPRLLAGVFGAMVALVGLTAAYNRAYNEQRRARAEERYRIGRTAADYGYYRSAIDSFGDALLYDRNNFDYRLGLALSLYDAGRGQEAEYHLLELRAREPTDATTNLLLARLASRSGRVEQAANYYRTAIHGRWPQNVEQNRVATRFELIELFDRTRDPVRVLAELRTALQDEGSEPRLARRLGPLFLRHGSPGEALAVLAPLADGPFADAELFAELGEASFQTRAYARALDYFDRALRAGLTDGAVAEQRTLTAEILALDPTPLGLPLSRRRARAREVLRGVKERLERCANPLGDELAGPPRPLPGAVRDLLASANGRLAENRRSADFAEVLEGDLLLAQNLWRLRDRVCDGAAGGDDPALAAVMELLAS